MLKISTFYVIWTYNIPTESELSWLHHWDTVMLALMYIFVKMVKIIVGYFKIYIPNSPSSFLFSPHEIFFSFNEMCLERRGKNYLWMILMESFLIFYLSRILTFHPYKITKLQNMAEIRAIKNAICLHQ